MNHEVSEMVAAEWERSARIGGWTMTDVMTDQQIDVAHAVTVTYRNYRGETAERSIIPIRIWFGSTEWHPGEQWFLDAFDVNKNAVRSLALRDILDWS
jgi:predicted DNA-binding transcriptional regulator YafY